MTKEEFILRLNKEGLNLNDKQIKQFDDYAFFLKEYNKKINLTGIDEYNDVLDKHFYDSLLLSFNKEIKGTLVDVGSGAGNKINPAALEISDIYKTTYDPLCKVMRRELKKRHIKNLKVVYSKEKALRPIEDMAISCRSHCVCPPGTVRKCTQRRDIPGSTAFVPSTMGLIIAGEVIKDLTIEEFKQERKEIDL